MVVCGVYGSERGSGQVSDFCLIFFVWLSVRCSGYHIKDTTGLGVDTWLSGLYDSYRCLKARLLALRQEI